MIQSCLSENTQGAASNADTTRSPSMTEEKLGCSLSHLSSDACSSRQTNGPNQIQSESERMLPWDFIPSPYTVIIGRGKRIAQTVGNRRLRILAKMALPKYAEASNCKATKTKIVNKIVETVKNACADNHCEGTFVRYTKGRYYVVDESVAREKVGYQLRDLLGDKYESSSKSKVAKKHRKRLISCQGTLGGKNDAINSSFDFAVRIGDCHFDRDDDEGPNPTTTTPQVSTTSTGIGSSTEESPTSIQKPIVTFSRSMKRMSFDAMQLINQPLIFGRESIEIRDGLGVREVLEEVCPNKQASHHRHKNN